MKRYDDVSKIPLEEYRKTILGNYPTIREQLAMAALTAASLTHLRINEHVDGTALSKSPLHTHIVDLAFNMADEILKQREKK